VANLINQIEQLIAPALHNMGLEIVRVLLTGNQRQKLQVMIERSDLAPVTMDNCVDASREISLLLDVEDPIEGSYRLEVTSPGLDRPLMKPADYQRFVGARARIQTQLPIAGRRNFTGIIVSADEEVCEILVQGKGEEEESFRLPFIEIQQGRLDPEVEFNKLINNKAKKG
jgi:ribosome maturation factor RimP